MNAMRRSTLVQPTPSMPSEVPNLPPAYRRTAFVKPAMSHLLLAGTLAFPVWLLIFHTISTFLTGNTFSLTLHFTPAGLSDWLRLLFGFFVAGPLLIVLHEGCHGLLFRLNGFQPRYGFRWLYAYATAPNALMTRRQALSVTLAPLVLLTLMGLLLLPFAPTAVVPYIILFLTANAAGAIGDLWLSVVLLRLPDEVRIVDQADQWGVYAPVDSDVPVTTITSGFVLRWFGMTALVFLIITVLLNFLPLLAVQLDMDALRIGPAGIWYLIEFERTPDGGFQTSLGLPATLVVSIVLGGGLAVLLPQRPAETT
ncbi:hypothetical protein ARMA_0132 [Ardenticatena maritima]|uniref:Zincin peptidase n=2 Tax=Ardenticatena maritima TaxID=872965 RepID=A0A0M8K6W5_9CHLR|nr:hypothetical protein ARMA_0132 [Ardenticatena maritima]